MTKQKYQYSRNAEIFDESVVPVGMQRIAMCVEYSGEKYCGWQRQSHSPSVQQEVEEALSKVANETITLICAGRTDTGVHATGQIIHFDTIAVRAARNWMLGVNANLPRDIRITWVNAVGFDFHARFSAQARSYRYLILNRHQGSAHLPFGVTWERKPLEEQAMHRAAQCLVGEHDFSSFRAAGCQAHSPVRHIYSVALHRKGELIMLDIRANAFLHHMVRNIVGCLLEVGSGRKPEQWVSDILLAKDRTQNAPTASPHGLYLTKVEYPEKYQIPSSNMPFFSE